MFHWLSTARLKRTPQSAFMTLHTIQCRETFDNTFDLVSFAIPPPTSVGIKRRHHEQSARDTRANPCPPGGEIMLIWSTYLSGNLQTTPLECLSWTTWCCSQYLGYPGFPSRRLPFSASIAHRKDQVGDDTGLDGTSCDAVGHTSNVSQRKCDGKKRWRMVARFTCISLKSHVPCRALMHV
jgi:hypothetical protein